jgi:hypothetical protein
MGIFVAAEFDSVDLADLAIGRLHNVPGIIGTEVLRNQFAAEADDDTEAVLPIIPSGAGWSFTSGMAAGPLYAAPAVVGSNDSSDGHFEPARRQDALLRVETSDENAAGQISSILRNIGGRSVRVMHH